MIFIYKCKKVLHTTNVRRHVLLTNVNKKNDMANVNKNFYLQM